MIEAFQLVGEILLKGAQKTEKELKGIEKKLKVLGGKFQDFGDKMQSVGQGMSKAITLPLTALGIGAIKTASDMQSSQAIIQQELGLSAKEAEELNGVAKDLWKEGFGESIADVATKVAGVTKSLGELSTVDLSYVTKGLDLFEKRGWGDQQESMRAIKTLMDQFGMSAQEATDYVTAGFQENLNYSGNFLDVISEYGTYFHEMGFAGEEFFSTLKAGAEAGAFDIDKVGDAMKEFSVISKENSEISNGAFEQLGLNSTEMTTAFNKGGESARQAFSKVVGSLNSIENETVRNQIATDLFGTQYEDLGEEAFNAMLKASGGLENVEGATKRANDAMKETFGARWKKTLRTAQSALEPLGLVLLDFAEKILPPLTSIIEKVANWFGNLSTEGQVFTVIIGAIMAIIPPLLVFFGMIASTIGMMLPHIIKAWNIFKKLRLVFALLSGPVGIVIAILTALVAVGIYLYQNWDTIKVYLIAIWNAIVQKALAVWNGLVTFFWTVINAIYKSITDRFNSIKNFFIQLWEAIKIRAKVAWWQFKNFIVKPIQEAVAEGKQKFTDFKNKLIGIWEDLKNRAREKFNAVKKAITDPIQSAKEKISGWVQDIKDFFTGLRIKIPKIEMPSFPTFRVRNWSWNPKDWISNPPSIGVSWNAQGGYVNGATLIGAGEAGGEGIVPLEGKHMLPIAQQIADFIGQTGQKMAQSISVEVPLIINGREIARAIAPNIDTELQRQKTLRKRGV